MLPATLPSRPPPPTSPNQHIHTPSWKFWTNLGSPITPFHDSYALYKCPGFKECVFLFLLRYCLFSTFSLLQHEHPCIPASHFCPRKPEREREKGPVSREKGTEMAPTLGHKAQLLNYDPLPLVGADSWLSSDVSACSCMGADQGLHFPVPFHLGGA